MEWAGKQSPTSAEGGQPRSQLGNGLARGSTSDRTLCLGDQL